MPVRRRVVLTGAITSIPLGVHLATHAPMPIWSWTDRRKRVTVERSAGDGLSGSGVRADVS